VRRKAAKSIGRVLGDNIRVFSLITNTLIKDKEIEDRWRGYARPVSYRNLSNQVEDEVVDALVTSVKRAYARISHRYYRIKADWLGVEKLRHWDRNAPLPEREDKRIDWNDARRIVSDAYVDFVPEFGDLVGRFFEGGWIDAKPRPGKDSGAFSHPTVPDVHPYILMSFHGRTRDVMTLAHELGHGIHQLLAAPQGLLMSDTPLTLAETASVFGEMLTFRSMLASETDPRQRRVMLASKIEDMINTVIRQTAFYEFERRLHDERRAGELSAERIGEIWLSVQSESLGPAFQFDDEYAYYWSYIPHFVHSPFYVYAYAFGDCLVNSLYQLYQDGTDDFQGKYVAMLKSGGTLRHKELLAPFGLDAADPEFWQRGLGVVSGFIDELEQEL
jgi:oligoendopeptidase F